MVLYCFIIISTLEVLFLLFPKYDEIFNLVSNFCTPALSHSLPLSDFRNFGAPCDEKRVANALRIELSFLELIGIAKKKLLVGSQEHKHA